MKMPAECDRHCVLAPHESSSTEAQQPSQVGYSDGGALTEAADRVLEIRIISAS